MIQTLAVLPPEMMRLVTMFSYESDIAKITKFQEVRVFAALTVWTYAVAEEG